MSHSTFKFQLTCGHAQFDEEGHLIGISCSSGHYHPGPIHLHNALVVFSKLGVDLGRVRVDLFTLPLRFLRASDLLGIIHETDSRGSSLLKRVFHDQTYSQTLRDIAILECYQSYDCEQEKYYSAARLAVRSLPTELQEKELELIEKKRIQARESALYEIVYSKAAFMKLSAAKLEQYDESILQKVPREWYRERLAGPDGSEFFSMLPEFLKVELTESIRTQSGSETCSAQGSFCQKLWNAILRWWRS